METYHLDILHVRMSVLRPSRLASQRYCRRTLRLLYIVEGKDSAGLHGGVKGPKTEGEANFVGSERKA